MSKETILAFWAKVEQDPALLDRMKTIASDDAPGVVAFAKELGFSVDWEDLWDLPGQTAGEKKDLSDESLDAASGGKCCCSSTSGVPGL